MSIIDVRNLAAAKLVQRKCVTVKDAAWISSQISWNLDQAHKLIGMNSDSRANLISVPVSYYHKEEQDSWWWYRYESAVGLMTWIPTKYDDEMNSTKKVLESHGTVLHPNGQVRRTIVFTHQGATPRRMMLNLSDTHLSLVDIDDLNAPQTKAVVEVAPYVQGAVPLWQLHVEHVRPDGYGGWYTQTVSEFRSSRWAATLIRPSRLRPSASAKSSG